MHIRLIFLLTSYLVLSYSQEFRGTILGRVTDPQGAVLAGTKISVTNVATGARVEAITNDQGNYQVPFLIPGEYRLRVESAGFRTLEKAGVQVETNSSVTVDLALELGQSTETVTVNAAAPMLATANADLGAVVQKSLVDNVAASLSRNALKLTDFAPGLTGDNSGTYTSNAQNSISISGGGGLRGGNEIFVDGVPNTIPAGGGYVVYVPSIDSVDEVKVHNTMFDAAYGHSNGGAISFTTRGGTNEYHGTAYLYKRWAALNANNWANNATGVTRPPVDYYQAGGLFAGPVRIPKLYDGHNKTFFLFSMERDSDNRDNPFQGRVPTALERKGDFSQTLSQSGQPLLIYNPFTTVVEGGKATRQAFPNAVIPGNLLNPTGLAVASLYPLPNLNVANRLGVNNYSTTEILNVSQRQYSGRIDQNISDKHRLFGRVSELIRSQYSDPWYTGESSNGGDKRHFWSAALDYTFVFSPTFVGSIRYGLARKTLETAYGGYGLSPGQLSLAGIINTNQAVPGLPTFDLGDPTMVGSSFKFQANDVHSLLPSFTKLSGKHSFRFGADYRLSRYNVISPGTSAFGTFAFDTSFTQSDPFTASTGQTTGAPLASLLLGVPTSGSLGQTSSLALQNHYTAGFVQDDWKLTRRITLNFGLRYELETPYTERYNHISYGFDFTSAFPLAVPGVNLRGGPLYAGVNGNSRTAGNVDTNNFGPRFGFAVELTHNTVIRGGYGLFYAAKTYDTTFLGDIGTFSVTTPYVASTDSNATPYTTLANPFPAGLRVPTGSAQGLAGQAGNTLTFLNPYAVNPYNQQWQFSVQQQLPGQILLEAAYLGMLSLKQFESFNLNEKPDAYLPLGSQENTKVPNPFLGIFPSTSTLGQGSTISQRQLWLAYPQYTTLTEQGVNTGRATYNSLQLKAEKRLSHGLTVLTNYTFSKLMTANTTSIVNPRHYRSVGQYDQTHVYHLAFSYQLPLHSPGSYQLTNLWRHAAGGWVISSFLDLESGLPLNITGANGRPVRLRDASLSGPVNQRLGDKRDAQGNVLNPYFDVTAFQHLPNQYTITPEPLYFSELRAPGVKQMNASLQKEFRIYERFRAILRLDAINATNTPNFSPPGTNSSSRSSFGVITSTVNNPRQLQGSLRIRF